MHGHDVLMLTGDHMHNYRPKQKSYKDNNSVAFPYNRYEVIVEKLFGGP
jgi:hypothetical protein